MANQIKFKAGQFDIEQKSNIKILGYILNSNLSHENYLNAIISKVNYRLHTFGLINRYMCQKVKILVVTSIIYSIIRYSCALMTDLKGPFKYYVITLGGRGWLPRLERELQFLQSLCYSS